MPLFLELIDQIRNDVVLPRRFMFQETEYRVIAAAGSSNAWSGIYQIGIDQMLTSFYQLRNMILLSAAVLVVLAAIASYFISASFTSNTRKLKKLISEVRYDTEISRIPSLGEDEIGDLAKHFNGLLDRLDQTYHAMLMESQEKQHAKYELLLFRYRSLQAQISPHFLCNILSSINMLSMNNKPEQVEEARDRLQPLFTGKSADQRLAIPIRCTARYGWQGNT